MALPELGAKRIMAEIIEVLQELGELAHWTQTPAPAPHGNLTCPAIVAFRFISTPRKAEDILEMALASIHGNIAWHLSTSGCMWVIQPKRIPDLTKERGLLGGLEAARIIMQEDPEFGLQSNRELASLADHIRTVTKAFLDSCR